MAYLVLAALRFIVVVKVCGRSDHEPYTLKEDCEFELWGGLKITIDEFWSALLYKWWPRFIPSTVYHSLQTDKHPI